MVHLHSRPSGHTLGVNFLSLAIPAVREIRAPLISGYLWLLALWLLMTETLSGTWNVILYGARWDSVLLVWDNMSDLARLAFISFFAYMIGSLISFVPRLVWGIVLRQDGAGSPIDFLVPDQFQAEAEKARSLWAEASLRMSLVVPGILCAILMGGPELLPRIVIGTFFLSLGVQALSLWKQATAAAQELNEAAKAGPDELGQRQTS